MKNKSWKQSLAKRSAEFIIVIFLLVATLYSYDKVIDVRGKVANGQIELIGEPERLAEFSRVTGEMDRRRHDVGRILSLVPSRQDVGQVISAIETLAASSNVSVEIPKISEDENAINATDPLPPFVAVQLDFVSRGKPNDLIQFLHSLETANLLSEVPVWSLRTNTKISPALQESLSVQLDLGDETNALLSSMDGSIIIWIAK